MKLILFVIPFFLFTSNTTGQKIHKFEGILLDSLHQPISNAHIKVLSNNTGVITNADGIFLLKTLECNPKLKISHINYNSIQLQLNCINNDYKTIILEKNILQLNEVSVTALTAQEIVSRCIQNLEENHGNVETTYRIFNREIEHTNFQPVSLREYLFEMGHGFNNKCFFKLLKYRVKPFNKLGANNIEDLRLINIHSNNSHILLRFVPGFLKRTKKKYSYSLHGIKKDGNKEYYVIRIFSNKNIKNAILHIETKSYAVSYLKYFYKDEKFRKMAITNAVKESFFEEINDKWYFNYGKKSQLVLNDDNDVQITYESIATVIQTEAKLNLIKNEDMGNMAQKLQEFQGKFEESFWKTNNFIPLPDWLKEQMN